MKSTSIATKLLMAALVLTVLIYFGINLAAYFMEPFTTTVAYGFTSENAVTVSGYVVRQETVLEESGGSLIYVSRGEGEKVSRGGTVAQIYESAQDLDNANRLRSLTEQMEQLSFARSLVSGAQSSLRLDEEVAQALVELHTSLADRNISHIEDMSATLRSAVLKRSYAYSGTQGLDGAIARLQGEINTLSASVTDRTTSVIAPVGGLFSGLVDGYETVLLPEDLEEMTPVDYREITPADTRGVGKVIQGTQWHFVTLMREKDMGRLREGDKVTLRFQSGLDRDMEMTVERISDEDGGQRLVVLTSRQYLNLTTLLRHQNAQIIFDSYTGIRVPRSAVRILWEDVRDEEGKLVLKSDGTPQQKQIMGVYCLWGTTARLKPVEILWQEEEYLLVAPSEDALAEYSSSSTKESRRLRAGDEVIIAAEDLYDGKVIE